MISLNYHGVDIKNYSVVMSFTFNHCQAIIGDIMEAGWSVKKPRENESISEQDLRNLFDKVDKNKDSRLNRMVFLEVNN